MTRETVAPKETRMKFVITIRDLVTMVTPIPAAALCIMGMGIGGRIHGTAPRTILDLASQQRAKHIALLIGIQ